MPGHVPGFGVLRAIGPARPNRGGETLRRSGRISHAPFDEAKALLRHHIGPAHETLMSLMLRMTTLILLIVAAAAGAGAVVTLIATARIEAAHPPAGRLVEVSGGRLHLLELGPTSVEQQPPIVMVHGASGNVEDLRLALGERLAADRRVILVDRPGHGWSDRPG